MITKDEMKNIAMLSKLFVTEEELDILTADVERMVDFVAAVSDADVPKNDSDESEDLSSVYREDAVIPSASFEAILSNAPEQEDGCFLVRKRA